KPTEEQLIATAFHRNTLTNNEGGTNDEEFRNVAVVDRVNTTLTVWMGTSVACAQCHNHKYDPISQKEFFRLCAFLNNTEDNDRPDERPLLTFLTDEQKRRQSALESETAAVEKKLTTPTPELRAGQAKWEQAFPLGLRWQSPEPVAVTANADARELPLTVKQVSALRLEAKEPAAFPVRRVTAAVVPPQTSRPSGRFVRVELPGPGRILSLAEVQIFRGGENVAGKGTAKQSSTDYEGEAKRAIDGVTEGDYYKKNSVTHTAAEADPCGEADFKAGGPIDRIVIWNRPDGGVGVRLANFRLVILDEKRQPLWQRTVKEPPSPNTAFDTNGVRPVAFATAFADAGD